MEEARRRRHGGIEIDAGRAPAQAYAAEKSIAALSRANPAGDKSARCGVAKEGIATAMRDDHTERLRLVPVTPGNANVLWNVLQEPDLRDYQDLPDIGLTQFLAHRRDAPEPSSNPAPAAASNG